MNFTGYADRIEEHVDEPDVLRAIREEVRSDEALIEDERDMLVERVGLYLADADRAQEPFDETTVPDEDADASA